MTQKRRPKRNTKKQFRKSMIGRPPSRPLQAPNIYRFKRSMALNIELSPDNPYWVTEGNALGKAFAFSLSNLAEHTEFKDLFKYYRLKGARVRIYFSNTGAVMTGNDTTFPNSQILVTIDRNVNGETTNVATEDAYLQSQTAKRRVALGGDRKPIDIYMPLKQGNLIYQTSALTNNTLMNPKFIATENDDTPHWGYNIMLQRVDGQPFSAGSTNYQSIKMITTIYLETKKVE